MTRLKVILAGFGLTLATALAIDSSIGYAQAKAEALEDCETAKSPVAHIRPKVKVSHAKNYQPFTKRFIKKIKHKAKIDDCKDIKPTMTKAVKSEVVEKAEPVEVEKMETGQAQQPMVDLQPERAISLLNQPMTSESGAAERLLVQDHKTRQTPDFWWWSNQPAIYFVQVTARPDVRPIKPWRKPDEPAQVPTPATAALLLAGLVAMARNRAK
jgi:hypothetical protein